MLADDATGADDDKVVAVALTPAKLVANVAGVVETVSGELINAEDDVTDTVAAATVGTMLGVDDWFAC